MRVARPSPPADPQRDAAGTAPLSKKAATLRRAKADSALREAEQRVRKMRACVVKQFPALEIWPKLDRQATAGKKAGLRRRLYALEFLRVESRFRAVSDKDWAVWELEEERIRQVEDPQLKGTRFEGTERHIVPDELLRVQHGSHAGLLNPGENLSWTFPAVCMSLLARITAAVVTNSRKPVPAVALPPWENRVVSVKDQAEFRLSLIVPCPHWRYFDQEGLLVWMDLSANKKNALRAVKLIYEKARKEKTIDRAEGQGRRYPLARLAQALRAYDKWKYDPKRPRQKEIGQKIDNGATLIGIANRMMRAASTGPEAWYKAFRL